MKKLALIENKNKRSFFWNFLIKTFKHETTDVSSKENLTSILENVNPDFVYLNLNEPVNGDEDLMDMLRHSDDINRLRVTIVTISIFSQMIDTALSIKNSFRSLFHIKKEEIIYKK